MQTILQETCGICSSIMVGLLMAGGKHWYALACQIPFRNTSCSTFQDTCPCPTVLYPLACKEYSTFHKFCGRSVSNLLHLFLSTWRQRHFFPTSPNHYYPSVLVYFRLNCQQCRCIDWCFEQALNPFNISLTLRNGTLLESRWNFSEAYAKPHLLSSCQAINPGPFPMCSSHWGPRRY